MGILAVFKHRTTGPANRADAKNDRRYSRTGAAAASSAPAAFAASADDPTHRLPRISRDSGPQ
ncbi:MAG TPA: hypothetical protein VGX23_17395 [Actinocrinis sp.]|nr:hypothetical protein [Actinocrinis sp.]